MLAILKCPQFLYVINNSKFISCRPWKLVYNSVNQAGISSHTVDWNSLAVIGNSNSGNHDADRILCRFEKYLEPVQFTNVAYHPPENTLKWCSSVGHTRSTVLVIGGDGTASSILTNIIKLELAPEPYVAVLPAGTGNDLAQVLGWGTSFQKHINPVKILKRLQQAKETFLDRWYVETKLSDNSEITLPGKTYYMYNYISIGVDAKVTLDFQTIRNSSFYKFGSTKVNKMLYFCSGMYEVMKCWTALNDDVEVYINEKKVQLPTMQSLTLLNIPFWAAGVPLWNMGQEPKSYQPQSINDNTFEVVCLGSLFHTALVRLGVSEPKRLCQTSCIKIKLYKTLPVQIDGEAWEQPPGEIYVTFHSQASVLCLGQ